MAKLYSKLFRKGNEIHFIDYNPERNYLSFVDTQRSDGFIQIILHSKLMLDICELFLNNNFFIRQVTIDDSSFIDVDDLKLENINNINMLYNIKEELNFNDDNYIEIKNVTIEDSLDGFVFSLRSNGILVVSEEENEEVISRLENLLYTIFAE